MLCRAECSNWNFGIGRTGILWNSLSIVYPVDIHFCSAVRTIHQSGPWMCFSPSIWVSSYITSDPLYIIKGLLVYDRLLRVLKHRPLVFPYIMAFLILEMLSGFKVYHMTKVLPFFSKSLRQWKNPIHTDL